MVGASLRASDPSSPLAESGAIASVVESPAASVEPVSPDASSSGGGIRVVLVVPYAVVNVTVELGKVLVPLQIVPLVLIVVSPTALLVPLGIVPISLVEVVAPLALV